MHLVLIAAVIIVLYVIQKRLYKKNWKRGLRVSLCFDREYMECGEEGELVEEIENDKALPLPVFHFKFSVDRALQFYDKENAVVTDYYYRNDVFSILGHQKIRRTHLFRSCERGLFQVETVNLMVRDFFMTSVFADVKREEAGIYVFPKKLDTGRIALLTRGKIGELAARRSLIEDPLSFRGLRDYRPGDPMHSIHWKQSARTGEWKVNLFDATQDAEVRILLNMDTDSMIRTDRLLEEAISLASSLAREYLKKKIRVSLRSNGQDEDANSLREPGAGAELSHGITIDKYLTLIRKTSGKDVFLSMIDQELDALDQSRLYLVISPYYKDDLLERLDRFRANGAEVQCIVPYYSMIGFENRRSYLVGWEVSEYES